MDTSRRIYVDFDDVLSQTARAFTTLLHSQFKRTVAFEQIFSFDLGRSFGLNTEELARFMRLAHDPEFLATLEPVDGAAEALHALISLGYEIAIVTGRPPTTAEVSGQWLKKHRIPYHTLTFVDKYARGGIYDSHPSVITLDELSRQRFCLAVEDSGEMAVFLANGMGLPVALLDRPWNQELQPSGALELIRRCADWAEVLQRFGPGERQRPKRH